VTELAKDGHFLTEIGQSHGNFLLIHAIRICGINSTSTHTQCVTSAILGNSIHAGLPYTLFLLLPLLENFCRFNAFRSDKNTAPTALIDLSEGTAANSFDHIELLEIDQKIRINTNLFVPIIAVCYRSSVARGSGLTWARTMSLKYRGTFRKVAPEGILRARRGSTTRNKVGVGKNKTQGPNKEH